MSLKGKPSKTRSWFEPSSSKDSNAHILSSSNPGSTSAGNLKSWQENPLQDPAPPNTNAPPSLQPKSWHPNPLQTNPLQNHNFHFTSLSQQLPSANISESKKTKAIPTPIIPPSIPGMGPSPTPSPSPSPSHTGALPLPVFEDAFGVANSIYCRSLSKLSVSKDLPRFCSHIRIYKNRELILRPTNEQGTASHILDIKNFLHTLLTYLDPPELVKAFEENFSKFVTEELDIATRLQAFFNSGVLPLSCNTFAVLRCIHQEIIFPVVMKIRQTVYEMFPYKDVKGSWNIYVVLVEDKGAGGVGKGISDVHVLHTKKEQSHDPNANAHFEFEWAMALTLSPSFDNVPSSPDNPSINIVNSNGNPDNNSEITLQSLDFWIIDYWLNEGFDKNTRPLLVKLLQKFFHPSTATMCLWSKQDIFQVNVSRDFPRLAVKTTVTDLDKQLVLYSPAADSDKEPAFAILMLLVERLNPEYMTAIRNTYDTHVEKIGDKIEYSVKFSNFMHSLIAEKVIPESCLLVKVLKCITNEIIYPSAMTLREQIYTDFPYKDVRNSRKVIISISERKEQIKVSHYKSEQTNDSSVEFEWQVTFTISKLNSKNLFGLIWYLKQGAYSCVKSHLQIDRFVLSENISNSLKIRFRELVHNLAAGRAEKQGVPVPALEYLQSILQVVEGLDPDIVIRLPKVAKTVTLHTALHYLSNALAKVPFELPPVVVPKNRTDSLDISYSKRALDKEW